MILVTGATGNVGRNVVRQLLDAGEKVRALIHGGGRDMPAGVEVVTGDFAQPDTLPAALAGADCAFVFPVIGELAGFLAAATQEGLRHVVMLSTSAVTFANPGWVGERHQEAEQAVVESGLPWTFVRPDAFMANDLRWAPQIAGGVVRATYGETATAPIDERDIAAVAVRALLEEHVGKAYVLTGPQSLTQIDRVRILSEVLGRPVRFEEQPRAEFRAEAIRRGSPAPAVDFALDLQAGKVGKPAEVVSTVAEVTGRPARTYGEWLVHRAADFAPMAG
jgi:uncharacterized protein YbjT (DUF2867 family)